MSTEYFNVFHRTWWTANRNWPDGREPGAGKKHYIKRHVTEEDAHSICEVWNANHEPRFLSDKAEYEAA